MKNSICFIIITLFFSFISCNKDVEVVDYFKNYPNVNMDQRNPTPSFLDTSGWELQYLFNKMRNSQKSDLLVFLKNNGIPDWEKAFQKRGDEIRITSIPFVADDSITGIARVYVTNEDSVKIYYFSKNDIDTAIKNNLTTAEYHAYRGAIQSYILSSILNGQNANVDYMEWLVDNQNRIEERLKYYCIEQWNCGGYISQSTGWHYVDKNNFIPEWNGGENQSNCSILFRECWVDWTPRNFPGNWFGSDLNGPGLNNTNIGSHQESQIVKNAKSAFLKNWLLENGLDNNKFSYLIDCVGYLPSPFGGSADEFMVMDCMKESLYSDLNLPNMIIEELNQYAIGSDDWINILNVEYSSESWKKAWKRLTKEEKKLAKSWPLAALVIYVNKGKAEEATDLLYSNAVQHNDKADAFRHAFFNALNVRYINPDLVKQFGDAHETETHSDFVLEVEMDLFNNAIGRLRGEQNKNKSDEELKLIIQNEVIAGFLKYLKPINYLPPIGNNTCYWGCPTDPNGNHGITSGTQLVKTNL